MESISRAQTAWWSSWSALVVAVMVSALVVGFPSSVSSQATPAASGSIEISGLITETTILTVADLQAYPAEQVDVTYEAGGTLENHSFTGTSLFGVIDDIGLAVPEDARNPLLEMVIIVSASDGYQVVFSGGEIDPNFGNAPILLAWEQDGAPLEGEDGPVRIVVPGDLRGGRYVSGVTTIEIVSIREDGATPVA
jgi:DMSO/TMAO reductase YedYZ molybdopterin-dependent catalytic subunit